MSLSFRSVPSAAICGSRTAGSAGAPSSPRMMSHRSLSFTAPSVRSASFARPDFSITRAQRNHRRPAASTQVPIFNARTELMGREQRQASASQARRTPRKGDRIQLAELRLGVATQGTIYYVDDLQILIKWDDGRSQSMRRGNVADRFWIIENAASGEGERRDGRVARPVREYVLPG